MSKKKKQAKRAERKYLKACRASRKAYKAEYKAYETMLAHYEAPDYLDHVESWKGANKRSNTAQLKTLKRYEKYVKA